MNILCTICARGGSKGVKNKNIKELAGKPLLAYTIEYLKKWRHCDNLVVSTDSPRIAKIAQQYGAEIPYMRPQELATDTAFKIHVLQDLVKTCEQQESTTYDIIVDLDPTAPLRKQCFLDEAYAQFIKSDADNLYSVCLARKNPYFNMVELNDQGYAHLCKPSTVVRRQDATPVYELNASIYIYRRDFLMQTDTLHSDKTMIYEMPDKYSIDIDTELDFLFVEYLLKEKVVELD